MIKEDDIKIEEESLSSFEMSNISLKLNSYIDIFSSFDPRPFSERALSVDFIDEAKRASRDKISGKLELRILIPKKLRDLQKEKVIKKRLREHFGKYTLAEKDKYKKILQTGWGFVLSGILIMFLAAFFLYGDDQGRFYHFLLILFEPAGWFLFWEGLDLIIFEAKTIKPEYEFNDKLAKCDIVFYSY